MTEHARQHSDWSVPVFTIGTVSRRVGVSPSALRMWEERYGVVLPARDRHGGRLYTEGQVEELTWIRDAMSQGLTAAEAHRMLEVRRDTSDAPPSGGQDGRFQEWVLADHDRLITLCTETVARVPAAFVAYLGVHDSGPEDDAESWLLISSLRATRPEWYIGTAHPGSGRHTERLARGEAVSLSTEIRGRMVTEVALPVMVKGEWQATVGLVSAGSPAEAGEAVEWMLQKVQVRYEAWKAYATFESLTGIEPDTEADTA